ncbi:hypothetical protein [Aliarcobacter butzleri]|uniref:hypothetical protein n=1 Tax=Aliarcobacter butzleri TaxID=28197 RepID=UPI0021B1E0C7|nr:hypothetical protein [Aliarcobacter butzleri]MCT7625723.1 hypothetical protein [Aliarcobacter butzleri]MCT7637254.1 hypothetical protein [Aliarcobacter butzleri]UXC29433.1 hypothetical protein N3114_00105 [Aliarcobacter butzleri]
MYSVELASNYKIQINEFPNKCPRCHHAIAPSYLTGEFKDDLEVDIAFQCTNCQHIFLGNYVAKFNREPFYLQNTLPKEYLGIIFEKEIENISQNFIDIFNQSLEAESKNLNQLTGIGLRKALEFLIKDFLIYKKPQDEESIKITPLSRCINNYIDDVKLKKISERAVWLGNDETHYIRKWENKDIEDLKLLIKVTVNMIHNELLTEKYLQEMD